MEKISFLNSSKNWLSFCDSYQFPKIMLQIDFPNLLPIAYCLLPIVEL